MIGDKKHGFTLMEMLVALGLFSVVIVIATDLFLTFQKISRKTESLERLVSDARFITEQIAKNVREDTIDYGAYRSTPLDVAQTTLRTVTRDQTSTTIASADCQNGTATFHCVTIARGSTAAPERISGDAVWVTALQFYIRPVQNPARFDASTGNYPFDAQPRVTVFLSIANGSDPNARNYTHYDVQTTITSRVYER